MKLKKITWVRPKKKDRNEFDKHTAFISDGTKEGTEIGRVLKTIDKWYPNIDVGWYLNWDNGHPTKQKAMDAVECAFKKFVFQYLDEDEGGKTEITLRSGNTKHWW